MARDRYEPPHQGGETKKEVTPPPPRLEGTEMPDHLREAQARAATPGPKPVKLEPAKDELGQPADAPPVPPRAQPEPAPRVIDQSERSPDPERLRRFKIRCDQPFGSQPTRYVLAKKGDREGAVACYLEKTGVKAIMDTFPEGQAPRPMIYVKELPD
jgi:hypothetical protein